MHWQKLCVFVRAAWNFQSNKIYTLDMRKTLFKCSSFRMNFHFELHTSVMLLGMESITINLGWIVMMPHIDFISPILLYYRCDVYTPIVNENDIGYMQHKRYINCLSLFAVAARLFIVSNESICWSVAFSDWINKQHPQKREKVQWQWQFLFTFHVSCIFFHALSPSLFFSFHIIFHFVNIYLASIFSLIFHAASTLFFLFSALLFVQSYFSVMTDFICISALLKKIRFARKETLF